MAIETQNGDYNLYASAATIFNKTAAADHDLTLEIRFGDGTKNLNAGVGTLTITVTNDGGVEGGDSQVVYKGSQTRTVIRTGKLRVASGKTITITAQSSNSNDTDVDVTVSPLWEAIADSNGRIDLGGWLGGVPDALSDGKLQCSVQHIAASLDWRSTHAWYVAKSGNDANGGHEFGDALLTVAAAVAAAADGDVIILYPGAYDEEVDASALAGLTIKSAYGWGSQITNAGTPLTVGDFATVEGLRLTNDTEAEGKVGLAIVGTATVKIDGCLIESKGRGIYCGGSGVWITDGLIRNTIVRAAYDGVNAVVSDTLQMADCLVFTDGTYDSSGQHTAACKLYRRATAFTPRIVLQNSIFQAKRTDETSADTYALSNNYCRILSRDCYYESEASSYYPSGLVCGVHSQGILSLIGGRSAVQANNANTTLYSLRNSGGASSVLAVAPDVLYDATLTSGTITKTGFDPASDTVILAATQGSYAPAKAGDAMTLTAAYDPAKTAAQAGDEMALTASARTTLVAELEAEIADDATGEAVKQAIIDKLLENLPEIDDLSLDAIGTAAATKILSTPANKLVTDASGAVATDAASRTASKNTASEIRTAVGLATANLDTQLGAKATSTQLAAVQTHGDSTWATADVSGAATAEALAAAKDVIDAIATDTGETIPAAIAGIEGGSGGATAEEIWALAGAIDGKTPKQAMQYMAAMLAGLVSGAGTASETFVGLDGVTERVKFTTDADGNRTVVEYDPE